MHELLLYFERNVEVVVQAHLSKQHAESIDLEDLSRTFVQQFVCFRDMSRLLHKRRRVVPVRIALVDYRRRLRVDVVEVVAVLAFGHLFKLVDDAAELALVLDLLGWA